MISEETRRKMRLSHLGKKHSKESILKMSLSQKGKPRPDLQGKNNPNYGKTMPLETRQKISNSLKGEKNFNFGKKFTEEHKKKKSEALMGHEVKPETRLKLSLYWTGRKRPELSGEKSNFWKGGVSKENRRERDNYTASCEYQNWRKSVFKRDNYTCQKCGKKQGYNKEDKKIINVHAHHIKRFVDYPELRLELSNGLTLCKPCHLKVHSKEK